MKTNRFGLASASYSSIASSCVAQITADPSRIGARTGMFMTAMAPGILAGPPISGVILALQSDGNANAGGGGRMDKAYMGMQMFCGAVLTVGAGLTLVARVCVDRRCRVRV